MKYNTQKFSKFSVRFDDKRNFVRPYSLWDSGEDLLSYVDSNLLSAEGKEKTAIFDGMIIF